MHVLEICLPLVLPCDQLFPDTAKPMLPSPDFCDWLRQNMKEPRRENNVKGKTQVKERRSQD